MVHFFRDILTKFLLSFVSRHYPRFWPPMRMTVTTWIILVGVGVFLLVWQWYIGRWFTSKSPHIRMAFDQYVYAACWMLPFSALFVFIITART